MSGPVGASDLRRAKAHFLVADIEHPALDEAARHHLVAVLRASDGTAVTVTDGHGSWRNATWVGGQLELDDQVYVTDRPTRAITIGVAIPKQDRPEWIVQKLTEIGVATIAFIETDRSVVRWDAGRATKKIEKLQRTAVEALQQSRGVWLPQVIGPISADAMLGSAYVAEPGGEPPPSAADTFLVGPEGGWTARELALARGSVGLGPTILRVETAALYIAIQILSVV